MKIYIQKLNDSKLAVYALWGRPDRNFSDQKTSESPKNQDLQT